MGVFMYTLFVYTYTSYNIRVVCAEVVQLSCAVNARIIRTRRRLSANWCDRFVEVIDDWQAKTAFLYYSVGMIIIVNENNRLDYENADDKRISSEWDASGIFKYLLLSRVSVFLYLSSSYNNV